MFNLSGTELVFIAVLGLIVLGPEKLPGAMRRAGKVYREIRSLTGNVQREVQKVMEEPMRQVRELVEEPTTQLKKTAKQANDIFAGKMPHLERNIPAATEATPAASDPAPGDQTAGDLGPSPVDPTVEAPPPADQPNTGG